MNPALQTTSTDVRQDATQSATANYRAYRVEDAPELTELINREYGINRDLKYWYWKFHDNPAGEALSCVVEHNERLVAHFGGLPARFVVQGIERIGVQDVDALVEPTQRTFRGAAKLNRCRMDINRRAGADFLFGFAISSTSQISQAQFGYELVCQIPRMVKVLDHRLLLQRRRWTRPFSPLARSWDRWQSYRHPSSPLLPQGTHVEQIDRFDGRFDAFWQQVQGDYVIRMVRDARFLNWRYVEVPHAVTTRLALINEATGEIRGYIVLSESRDRIRRGRILDFMTPREGGERIADTLLAAALEHFRSRDVALVACWMLPHCHLHPSLVRSGFRPRRDEGRDVVFRNSDLQTPAISSQLATTTENWFLTMGDSDLT